jgi:hypothetical protein
LDRSGHAIIGVVGTAKNTGKTTTLSFLLVQAVRRNIPVGITSIGYDGEDIDTVTSLPKPRMTLEPGMLVTTAERCLTLATAGYDILSRTGIQTALGEILLLRITRQGLVVTAGPHKRSLIDPVCDALRHHGAMMIFIDGALNRIAPMGAADRIIFTTGAARNTDPALLAAEMSSIQQMFALPRSTQSKVGRECDMLLDADDVRDVLSTLPAEKVQLKIRRMVSLPALRAIEGVMELRTAPLELLLPDPMVLLLAGEPVQTNVVLQKLRAHLCNITFSHAPVLAAITVNPFFPLLELFAYSTSYIDKHRLLSAMQQAVSVPVYNVKDAGAERLFDQLM